MISKQLMDALIAVESGGRTDTVGDGGLSKGILQIHKCVVDDVNRICKTNYTHDDAFSPERAKAICEAYLFFWGCQYTKNTGNAITDEVLARIWNGGPKGYKKDATIKYWNKVKGAMGV